MSEALGVAVKWGTDRHPMDFEVQCNVCNRLADRWEITTPIREKSRDAMRCYIEMENTGEIIFQVWCHGETFRRAYGRTIAGEIPDDWGDGPRT